LLRELTVITSGLSIALLLEAVIGCGTG